MQMPPNRVKGAASMAIGLGQLQTVGMRFTRKHASGFTETGSPTWAQNAC